MSQDDFGYGQATPNDSASKLNVISFVVRQMAARMDTAKLVRVVAVTGGAGAIAAAGTVDVMPLVNQIDGNGNGQPHGVVHGIPWSRVAGGQNAVICDPMVGDVGYVVACDRDTSSVRANRGKQANPGSRRTFDVADGVYAGGGLFATPTQYLVFTADGARLADKSGNVVSMAATGITITPASGQPVTVAGNLIVSGNLQLAGGIESVTGSTYSGDLKTAGNVIAGVGSGDQVGLQTHTHLYARPTGASSPAQTNGPTAGT